MSREIKKCVLEIFDALCDRSGFDDWWYNLDDDTQEEIENEIEEAFSELEDDITEMKEETERLNSNEALKEAMED